MALTQVLSVLLVAVGAAVGDEAGPPPPPPVVEAAPASPPGEPMYNPAPEASGRLLRGRLVAKRIRLVEQERPGFTMPIVLMAVSGGLGLYGGYSLGSFIASGGFARLGGTCVGGFCGTVANDILSLVIALVVVGAHVALGILGPLVLRSRLQTRAEVDEQVKQIEADIAELDRQFPPRQYVDPPVSPFNPVPAL